VNSTRLQQSCGSVESEHDPDPAFQVNLDPDKIQMQDFDDKNLKKKYS
jgi:hypothetical protein